jgi:hypothetical protein
MQLSLTLDIPQLNRPLLYSDNVLLIGSCFTEHIADRLAHHKFKVLQNPHGILFNPLSVSQSLDSYIDTKMYAEDDLFCLNELWNSWDHHTRFSHTDRTAALTSINESQRSAAAFVREADWVIITLGSAFQYYLKENGKPVSNNHRAPAQWFEKKLLSVEEIVNSLTNTIEKLKAINPHARVLFTISPVRHIRDGVVDNNRSKARLIEATHLLCERIDQVQYFPAYELVIDILRDYRYYDIDFVHPNYMATTYVWEHFVKTCISPTATETMQQVLDIMTAKSHRTRFPETEAHRKFKASYLAKTRALQERNPTMDLTEELRYFAES